MSDDLEKRLREVSGVHFNDRVALWHHTINAAADELARLRLQLISASEAEEDAKRLRSENEALKEAMAEVDSTLFHSLTVGMLRERAAEILAAERKEGKP